MTYIVYFILLLLLLIFERAMQSERNIFRCIIPLVYILFVGLRGANVGVDTSVYYDHYYTFGKWGCDFVEVGFDWLNKFFYNQGVSQAPFFVVCSALCIIPVCYSINYRLKRNEYSIFMLLFCTVTFVSLCNGMRQNIACGILFFLLLWYDDSNLKLACKYSIFIFGVLFASLFHASVLLLIPVVLCKKITLNDKYYILIYMLSFMFVYVNISSFIPEIQIGLRDYSSYVGSSFTNQSASSLGFVVISIRNFLTLLLMIGYGMFRKYKLFSNMVVLMFVLINIGYNIPLLGRMVMYFDFFFILIVSKMVLRKASQYKQLCNILLLIIIFVITVYSFVSPSNRLLPYNFYWETIDYMKYLK